MSAVQIELPPRTAPSPAANHSPTVVLPLAVRRRRSVHFQLQLNLHQQQQLQQQPRSIIAAAASTFGGAGCKRSSQGSMLSGDCLRQQQQQQRLHSSHSVSTNGCVASAATTALRRESLKLSFNRSISEPHAPGVAGIPAGNGASGIDPPVLSPPSCSPSLHPSKRCRMEQVRQQQQQQQLSQISSSKAEAPSVMAPPASATTPSGCFLRPPPQSILAGITPAGTVSLPASPCSESSTLQRTLLLQRASTIDHRRLASRLELRGAGDNNNGSDGDFLLVDCRPFIAFNVNHIRGAINVNCCDRFNRKRLQQGKATLADLATTKEGKEALKRRTWREVVVYDDCSDSLETLPVSHTLFLVMNALAEDHREPVMLLGGLRDFQVAHRSLCADHLMHGGPPPAVAAAVTSPTSPLAAGRLSFAEAASSSSNEPPLPSHFTSPVVASAAELRSTTTKDIENHPATQVLPYLYLGNMRDAADTGVLKRLGVKYVLNVTAKPPNYSLEPDIVYKQLEAADNGIQVKK